MAFGVTLKVTYFPLGLRKKHPAAFAIVRIRTFCAHATYFWGLGNPNDPNQTKMDKIDTFVPLFAPKMTKSIHLSYYLPLNHFPHIPSSQIPPHLQHKLFRQCNKMQPFFGLMPHTFDHCLAGFAQE